MTLLELRQQARDGVVPAEVRVQVEEIRTRQAANGNPFREIRARDEGDAIILRAWHDSRAFSQCEDLGAGEAILVTGEFAHNATFGLDARKWDFRRLTDEERRDFFGGDSAAVDRAWEVVHTAARGIVDPRLRLLCERFLNEYGARFRRAAAARRNHHARRGGLIEHTAQMLKAAAALCGVYQDWNADLLTAGIIFHDCGKLWETCPPEEGFGIPFLATGELLGHITMGAELVNMLWKQLPLEQWEKCRPSNEEVRRHLLHLIVAHHGTHEFGSPVLPRTPEAFALHFIDNLDAKLEAVRAAYQTSPQLADGIFERGRILPANLIAPLPRFSPEE